MKGLMGWCVGLSRKRKLKGVEISSVESIEREKGKGRSGGMRDGRSKKKGEKNEKSKSVGV